MGISIEEYKITMETYGAKLVCTQWGTRYNINVPCFELYNISFIHSGSYYVVPRGTKCNEYVNKAMQIVGEEYPGGKNFWYGEVHTIRGLLTLCAVSDNNYSKEYVDELTDKVYSTLMTSSHIWSNNRGSSYKKHFSDPNIEKKWSILIKKIEILHNLINPFGSSKLNLKKPHEYIDRIIISCNVSEQDKDFFHVYVESEKASFDFKYDDSEWSYNTHYYIPTKIMKKVGGFCVSHYKNSDDDFIVLDYYYGKATPYERITGNLRISLITGKSWSIYPQTDYKPVTLEELNFMISFIERECRYLRKNLVNYMIKDS